MGDRRVGERREPEKGVIKINTKNAIIYGIIAIVLIISISANIILANKYAKIKNKYGDLIENESEDMVSEPKDETNDYINTCDVEIYVDKDKLKTGEAVTYKIMANNIMADDGIVLFETLINYDSNIFECKVNNSQNDLWVQTSMIDNYLTMTRRDFTSSVEDQTVATITFTAKKDINLDEETITFNNIKFTMGNGQSFQIDKDEVFIEF